MILTGKTVIVRLLSKLQQQQVKFGSWFSFLTEPPPLEGNLTSDQRRVRLSKLKCLEKECILDMARVNAHFQQHA